MPKKADNIMGAKDDSDDLPLPEPPPERVSSAETTPGVVAPRAARFGEGEEGRAARRERNLSGPSGPHGGFFERTGQFWRDVRAELKRVTWPTSTEVKNTTIITIIAVIFFALYLFAIDQALAFLIEQLFRFVNWLVGAL